MSQRGRRSGSGKARVGRKLEKSELSMQRRLAVSPTARRAFVCAESTLGEDA